MSPFKILKSVNYNIVITKYQIQIYISSFKTLRSVGRISYRDYKGLDFQNGSRRMTKCHNLYDITYTICLFEWTASGDASNVCIINQ